MLNLDELSSVNISVILNGNVSRLSSCKMPCLVFELMLGSECVSDVRLPHLHSELCRVCLHQRRRWPCERLLQHLQPVRVTETQSMDEPVRRDFLTSSTQHSRISEDTRAVCARSTHAEHSGLSMNKIRWPRSAKQITSENKITNYKRKSKKKKILKTL